MSPAIPPPVSNQTITLESSTTKKVQGQFVRPMATGWLVKIDRKFVSRFKPRQKITLLYASVENIYHGDAIIESVFVESGNIALRAPEQLFSRPRRQHQRKATYLPAALIMMSGPRQPMTLSNEFIGRRNNMILNISKSGVLLATTVPLPETAKGIMLLMGLNIDDPFHESSQVAISGEVVRNIASPDPNFPHAYGIRLRPTFPAFQRALDYFIDVALDQESERASFAQGL